MTIRSAYDELALDVTDIERTLGGTTHDEQDFGPITPGAPVTGHVDPGNDLDYYTLNVVAGQSYVISMNGTGPDAMPDPQLFVYNSAGQAQMQGCVVNPTAGNASLHPHRLRFHGRPVPP